MSLKTKIGEEMKTAMKAKDKDTLAALRSIKSMILLAETEDGASGELSEEQEMKILTKAAKQRKDSAETYKNGGRDELAEKELFEVSVIEKFLPQQLSEAEITEKVKEIIAKVGASSMKDMGKVMGMASKEMAGKADNKLVSQIVKASLAG